MHVAWSTTRNTTWWIKRERRSVRNIKIKVVAVITTLMVGSICMFGASSKMKIYADMIVYVVQHGIAERFWWGSGGADDYFWWAEVSKITPDLAVFGQGAGTSTMGVHYVLSEEEFASAGYLAVEHGPLKVWLEFGVLGLIQMSLLWGGLFMMDLMVMKSVRHRPRWLAASVLISLYHLTTLASFFVGHQYWDDVQGQIHFWLITGLQLCLWRWSRPIDMRPRRGNEKMLRVP